MTDQNFTMDRDPAQGVSFQPRTLVTVDLELSFAPELEAVRGSVDALLEALGERDLRATFFVQGELAEALPGAVGAVLDAGHELASHGHAHRPITPLSRQELRDDIARSQEILAECGAVVQGYRAPFFSASPHLESVLAELDFAWSSSTPRIWFPGRYDHRSAPEGPWTTPLGLVELPIARVHPLIPFSLEHMMALGPLFPSRRPACDAVFYMHSYSFSERCRRPFHHRWQGVSRSLALLDAATRPGASETLSAWLAPASEWRATGSGGP